MLREKVFKEGSRAETGSNMAAKREEKAGMGYLTYSIPFAKTEYELALRRYHFNEEDLQECVQVCRKLGKNAHIQAWYRYEADDELFVVMTLGACCDRLIEQYEQSGKLLKAYALDCFAMELLRKGYEVFADVLYSCENKYPGDFCFLEEAQMRQVPGILKDMGITEVSCNEAFIMLPKKTVVFMTKLSETKNANCGGICENCGRKDCLNRELLKEAKKKKEQYTDGCPGLNYGYRQILAGRANAIWKKD